MDAKKLAAAPPPQPPTSPPAKAGMATTLLDVYEVEWITRELERLLVREGAGAEAGDADRHRRRKKAKAAPPPPPPPAHKKGAPSGGVGSLLGRHAVAICGRSMGAAVEVAVAAVHRRRRHRKVAKV